MNFMDEKKKKGNKLSQRCINWKKNYFLLKLMEKSWRKNGGKLEKPNITRNIYLKL